MPDTSIYIRDKKCVALIALLLLFCSVVHPQGKKKGKKLSPKSVGLMYSEDYNYRWLYDNPRYIDSTGPITDKNLINYRNKYDRPRWGRTGGVIFERILDEGREKYLLQTGVIVTDMGEKITKSKVTDADYANLISGSNGNIVTNHYFALEFPIVLKFDVSPPNGFLGGKTRSLYGMAGLSIGTPALSLSAYDIRSFGNIMVRSVLGVGLSQQFLKRFKFSIAVVGRYSLVPEFKYEPINSYYYSLGAQAQLLFRLAQKGKQPAKSVVCKFVGPKKVKKKNSVLHGLIYGANVSRLMGSDRENPTTAVFGQGDNFNGFNLTKSKILMEYGTHIGLHTEKSFLRNKIALVMEYVYSRKGFRTSYEYAGSSGTLLGTANVRLDHIDIPLMLRYNRDKQHYLFAGAQLAFALPTDKISVYYQLFNDGSNPTVSAYTYTYLTPDSFFDNPARIFMKGFVAGAGYSIDERVDLNFRIQKTNSITLEKKFYNVTAQASLIYLLGKR